MIRARRLVVVQYSRQHVVELLRRAGLEEAAAEAMEQLPDPVELEDVERWAAQRGITRGVLMGRRGGSP